MRSAVLRWPLLLCLCSASSWVMTLPDGLRASASSVHFSLRLLLLHLVEGSFHGVRGALHERDGQAWICAEVRVDSARMASAARRAELLGPEFFDAARHPLITFHSIAVPAVLLREGGDLPGQLSLRGVRGETSFRFSALRCDPEAASKRCQVELEGRVRRSDYGISAKSALLGDWVRLRMALETCASASADDCAVLPDCQAPALTP